MSADHDPRRVWLIANVAVPMLLAVAVALAPIWVVASLGLVVLVCALGMPKKKNFAYPTLCREMHRPRC